MHDDVILLYDQNPSGFCFLVQIMTFLKNSLGLPNLNINDLFLRLGGFNATIAHAQRAITNRAILNIENLVFLFHAMLREHL